MSPEQEQRERDTRVPILDFFQGGKAGLEEGMVIGFALVIEVMNTDGGRGALVITSDASGRPLPYYAVDGLAKVLDEQGDFDQATDEDDE